MHGRRLLENLVVGLAGMLLPGLLVVVPATGQVPAPPPDAAGNSGAFLQSIIGEVTATGPAAKQIELKRDAGGPLTVILQERTVYLQVPPGETDLKKAVTITPEDIRVGDRVYVRARLAEGQTSVPALAVIVMTKADLTKIGERERADWQKRGVAGTLSGINPDTNSLSLSVRSSAGTRTLIVDVSPKTSFNRYAPDSVQFVQAKPSSFAELKVGDALRILGEKSSDGTRITAEAIVSGSFRNIAGTVSAIDVEAGEIRMTDLVTRRSLSVRITTDTMLRRMPAAKSGAKPAASATASPGAGSGEKPSGAATQASALSAASARPQQEGASSAGSGGKPSGAATQGGTGGGGPADPERMPVLALPELKRDEIILVLCTAGTEPSRVTAIVVMAGVEPLLGPALQDQTQVVGPWNFFDISVP